MTLSKTKLKEGGRGVGMKEERERGREGTRGELGKRVLSQRPASNIHDDIETKPSKM